MKIQRMQATYGTLQNASLELGEGLNIIEAPNESGKSTWCAFLRGMLYGVSTAEREKAGYLPDKRKYAPWNGGTMQGTMEVRMGEDHLTLERTGRASAPMSKLLCVKTGTFQRIPELEQAGNEVGKLLTGVSEDVFTRTAFVGQSGAAVSQTAELEKRIGAMVSSGEEGASASAVLGRLQGWKRGLVNGRGGGKLAKAESELEQQQSLLSSLEKRTGELDELRRTRTRLEQQLEALKADAETHKELARQAQLRQVLEAGKAARQAQEDLQLLEKRLTFDGKRVSAEDLGRIRESYAAFQTLASAGASAKTLRQEAEEARKAAEGTLAQYAARFSGASPEQAQAEAARLTALEAAAKAEPTEKKAPWTSLLPLLGCVLGAVLIALLPSLPMIVIGILAIAGGAAGCVMLRRQKPATPAHDAWRAASEALGGISSEQFSKAAAGYAAAAARAESLRAAEEEAEKHFQKTKTEALFAADAVLDATRVLEPGLREVLQVPEVTSRLEVSLEELHKAETNAARLQSAYETLRSGYDGELPEDLPYLPTPMRDARETEEALHRAEGKLSETNRLLSQSEGAMLVSGDPAVITAEITHLEAEIRQAREKLSALELAISAVSAAAAELQSRFSPALGRLASAYMQKLTGGRYSALTFDRTFAAAAAMPGDAVSHSALYLSAGSLDQLYLSLRLAMCELLLTGEDPCPLIFDDALANFDDKRAEDTLRVLYALSAKRQILLFTCHSREAAIVGGWAGVRITSI